MSILPKELRELIVIFSWYDDLYRRIDDVIPTPSSFPIASGTEKQLAIVKIMHSTLRPIWTKDDAKNVTLRRT